MNALSKESSLINMVDLTSEYEILESADKIFGCIYQITNMATGLKYVGQTVSHRKNKGKYKPFGIVGRFNDHISEAINNTKKKQCSYLNNAIRKYGRDSFAVELVEVCTVSELNEKEQYYINKLNTLFPHGYNLTKGGKTVYIETFIDRESLNPSKKRGGCKSRSDETRAKMSKCHKDLSTAETCLARSMHAKHQHHIAKLAKFKDCKIDLELMESYIRKKGKKVIISIDGIRAEFAGVTETIDQLKNRARAFINELSNATLSNCGESVKPE